jgi:L-arabinonolactonase
MERTITVPAINPSCCSLGGTTFDQLYITTAREEMDADALMRTPHAGGVYGLRLQDVRGVPENRVLVTA